MYVSVGSDEFIIPTLVSDHGADYGGGTTYETRVDMEATPSETATCVQMLASGGHRWRVVQWTA